MSNIDYNILEELDKEIESKIKDCLKETSEDKFKEKLKDELSDILIKLLDEKGYVDGKDKELIKNQVIILFENSDRQSETNNSLVEYMSIGDRLDDNDFKKLKYTKQDIKNFMGVVSKIDEMVEHVNRISEIYDTLNASGNYIERLTAATPLVIEEIGAILGYVPYVGKFLEFEMDLLKRLFEIESDLIKSHLEQINEADEALEEVLNPNNNISDEERSNKIKEFMNSNTYKGVGKIPPETYSEGEFSEQTKSLVDIIREENPEVWEEFKNSSAYKEYEKNTSRAQEAQNDFRESENQAKNCLNNGGALGDNPNEDNEDNPFSPGNNNTDNGNDDKYNSDSSSSS